MRSLGVLCGQFIAQLLRVPNGLRKYPVVAAAGYSILQGKIPESWGERIWLIVLQRLLHAGKSQLIKFLALAPLDMPHNLLRLILGK